MRFLGLFLSALALVGLIAQQSFGGFLDRVIIEYDKPVSVKGKEMTTLGGGGIRIRWQDQTYSLVNAVPPSLKMGCGGIDINLGALGLLNFDQFGKLFEALMGPAGVMFAAQLALSALCPQCAQVLQQLMNLANQLNQMQISKCGAVQMAGVMGQKAGEWIHDKIVGGERDNWMKAFDNAVASVGNLLGALSEQINKWCPNGKCGAALMMQGGCIVDRAVGETTVANFLGLDNRQLAAVVRKFLGDVCFSGKRNTSGKHSRAGVPQEPVSYEGIGDPQQLIQTLAGIVGTNNNGQITNIRCEDAYTSGDFPFVYIDSEGNIQFNDGRVRINTTICAEARRLMDRVFNAVNSRTPLSAEDKALLSAMPVGVFKLINYGSVYSGFLDGIKEDLAYYIAEEMAIGLLQKLTQKAAEWVAVYQSGMTQNDNSKSTPASEAVRDLLKNIGKAQKELANYRRYTMEQLRQKIQSYQVANQIYNDMLAQMSKSPIYGNMVFSRLIGLGPTGNR
jgi:arsenate reductase-like glutaredoxin family protein